MEDVLRRLTSVEEAVCELRVDVSAIKATLPHLATAASLNIVKADIHALEVRLIRWIVGNSIAVASVVFTIAKFVN